MKGKNIKLLFNFILLVCLLYSCGQKSDDIQKKETDRNVQEKEDKKTENKDKNEDNISKREITIIGVGDIMLGSNYPELSLLPKNGANILENTENVLKEADITIGNLEGTLFDAGGTPKKCSDPKVCYLFRTPSKYGEYLKKAGFDYLSIANNHSNDFGAEGIKKTMTNLDNLAIKYSGIKEKAEFALLEKDGIKYGFVSFAPNSRTVNINDHEYASNLIKSVKEKSDILIVMFHGGAEGNNSQHITREKEIFHGENRGNVFKFARMAIDSGADIVFGQGPHVTRAIELYKDKFISYSGGNFATYGKFNLSGPSGIAPIFKITVDNKGNFLNGEIISTKQYKGSLGPFIDKNNEAVKKIIFLNKADFPEGNGLNVSPEGKISKIK